MIQLYEKFNSSNKVFLGGTIGKIDWRSTLIKKLNIKFFNPIVEDWSEEDIEIENKEKEDKCNIHLYFINSEMQGVYSIAEAVDSVHNKKKITVFCYSQKDFTEHQIKSLDAVGKLVESRGGVFLKMYR